MHFINKCILTHVNNNPDLKTHILRYLSKMKYLWGVATIEEISICSIEICC